jgi:hypothetical protein
MRGWGGAIMKAAADIIRLLCPIGKITFSVYLSKPENLQLKIKYGP